MSEPWFHISPLPDAGGIASLDAAEARHASGARRLGKGDRLVLFDGRGRTAEAEIVEAGRRELGVRLLEHVLHPPPRPELHLASALPKGDRQSTLLAMSAQLGLTSFTPVVCANSVAREGRGSRPRWERILREACKQSRRPHLPILNASSRLDEWLAARPRDAQALALHPGGRPAGEWLRALDADGASAISLLIGPEGGFSRGEIARLEASGIGLASLGEGILRIETAAVAALSIFALLRERS